MDIWKYCSIVIGCGWRATTPQIDQSEFQKWLDQGGRAVLTCHALGLNPMAHLLPFEHGPNHSPDTYTITATSEGQALFGDYTLQNFLVKCGAVEPLIDIVCEKDIPLEDLLVLDRDPKMAGGGHFPEPPGVKCHKRGALVRAKINCGRAYLSILS